MTGDLINATDPTGPPTFVARFANGQTTRMTIATPLEPLDFERGARLAHLAMSLRASLHPELLDGSGKIVAAWFETPDGVKLADMPKESAP